MPPLADQVVAVAKATAKGLEEKIRKAEREARVKATERERSGCGDWSTLLSGFEPSIYD